MFSGDVPSARDQDGAFFIDRDGLLFRFLLNFLRDGDLSLPDDFGQLQSLKKEANFYQITALIAKLDEYPGSIYLNVGGVRYTTSMEVLAKSPTLKAMFGPGGNVVKDREGAFFIDRNGRLFEYVLNYLRVTLSLGSQPNGFNVPDADLDSLHDESNFYQLGEFGIKISARLDRERQREAWEKRHDYERQDNMRWDKLLWVVE